MVVRTALGSHMVLTAEGHRQGVTDIGPTEANRASRDVLNTLGFDHRGMPILMTPLKILRNPGPADIILELPESIHHIRNVEYRGDRGMMVNVGLVDQAASDREGIIKAERTSVDVTVALGVAIQDTLADVCVSRMAADLARDSD